MTQDSTDPGIMDFVNLEISPPSPSPADQDPGTPVLQSPNIPDSSHAEATGLHSLPEELIRVIVDHLWREEETSNWYDPLDGDKPQVLFRDRPGFRNGKRMRKSCLAFSSCCKSLRQIIFQEYLLENVTLVLSEMEWALLASLSERTRSQIK
jgi:hypothetical protein